MPLRRLGNAPSLTAFINELGWQFDDEVRVSVDLVDLIHLVDTLSQSILDLAKADDDDALDIVLEIASQIPAIVNELRQNIPKIETAINNAISNSPNFVGETTDIATKLSKRLFDYLVYLYLQTYYRRIFAILHLVGIVEIVIDNASMGIKTIQWDRVGLLFSNPSTIAEGVYKWNSGLDGDEFLARIELFMRAFLLPGGIYRQNGDISLAFGRSAGDDREMRIPLYQAGRWPGSYLEFDLNLSPNEKEAGLDLYPYIFGDLDIEQDLGGGWGIQIKGNAKPEEGLGILVELRPPHNLEVNTDLITGNLLDSTNVHLDVGIRKVAPGETLNYVFGSPEGSHLGYREIGFNLLLSVSGSTKELAVELEIEELTLAITSDNADGFIQKILSGININATSDLVFGYSNLDGVYFRGSGALAIEIPVHQFIGPIWIDTVIIGVGINQGFEILLAASFGAELGPVSASVTEIGLTIPISFPPNRDGNLGPVQVKVPQFKAPSGVGLAVNASGIAGGGVINFDRDHERYDGMLGLNFGDFGLTAIGLITTRLPDGSKGFSMLIIIGVTFSPPIQLVMGFTLSGVGGLLGINRSMNIEFLQKGIRNRTLDPILFPDLSTFIQNADTNFSILRSAFEPVDGRYIVGPMVKIGWGNNLITADLGIFLEFPAPIRIVLMGQVEAAFPKPDDPVVVLNLDVLGVLDIEKEELTFQASLYGSHILSYPLAGDSAFLLGWGQDRRLALSLGGFHPRFTPPPPPIVFADLKRLSLSISSGPDFQLAGTAYQALTPNSLQFGSWVLLYAKKGKATVTGHLGFDTLIYFSPFSFEVTIGAGVRVKYRGKSLAEISLSMVLSGPTPWNARGKAKIKILGVSIKVRFNFTWGRSEAVSLESVDPWPMVQEALASSGNWGSALPPGSSMVAFLRSFEDDGTYAFSVKLNHADTLDLGQLSADLQQEFADNGIELGQTAIVQVMEPGSAWRIVEDSDASGAYIIRAGSEALDVYDGSHQIVVHPSGRLEIKQNVVPLGVKLALYGNAPVAGHDLFNIESLTSDGEILDLQPIQEFFARGQFEQLSADQRLSLPAFEKMPGGVGATAATVRIDGEVETKALGYESILIKPDRTSEPPKPGSIAWDEAQHIVKAREAQRWAQRAGSRKRFSTADMHPQVGIPDEELYCIANATDLTRADLTLSIAQENRNLTRMVADQELNVQEVNGTGELMVIPECEVVA